MVVKELLTLPAYVQFEGIEFQLEVFKNGKEELRLCYAIFHVDKSSIHYSDWEKHGGWYNTLESKEDPPLQGSLRLYENISSDADMIWATRDCWHWLCRNNLLK